MSQQLIIQNDEDEDYVQFTVEVPDGYAGFNVACINGTMINQNYLNIGDVIKFSFSNNPITYAQSPKIKLTNSSTVDGIQPTQYKFIKLDLFNIYRVKYIPIYSYYGSIATDTAYVFNPSDENELLDEPTNNLPDYTVIHSDDGSVDIKAPFTGQFVIALEHVDKIDDIDVVIGESISNSKTQPETETLNEAGEIVADNQTGTTYTYGSKWRYDVSNLLMNHRFTIDVRAKTPIYTDVVYFAKNTHKTNPEDADEYYTSIWYDFNNSVMTYESRAYNPRSPLFHILQYQFSQQTFVPLHGTCQLPSLNRAITRKILIKSNSNYSEIHYDNEAIPFDYRNVIPKGLKLTGQELASGDYVMYRFNNDNTDIVEMPFDFKVYSADHYFYTGNATTLNVYNGSHLVKNKTLRFTTYDHKQIIKTDKTTTYTVVDVDSNENIDITFKKYTTNKNNKDEEMFVLGEEITTDYNGRYTFISTVNVGYTDLAITSNSIDHLIPEPLQLTTEDNEPADDDLIIKHVVEEEDRDEGLLIRMNTLSNYHYLVYRDNQTGKLKTIREMMKGAKNTEPLVFIPKKSNIVLKAFEVSNDNNEYVVPGMMKVQSIFGDYVYDLNDDECSQFLASGHDTLNVSPPQSDDYKFKTFNASITFDRSQTRITRLYSMSNCNSAIGYINDILSAKLSRYYFAANYSIFNTFIDEEQKMVFSNSLNQAQTIYGEAADGIFTGKHEVLLANCGDIVKLIGSDVVVNNCMPGITNEEHIMDVKPIPKNNYSNLMSLEDFNTEPFYYKLFHYYDSGFNQYPTIGGDEELPKGISLLHVSGELFKQTSTTSTIPGIDTFTQVFISNTTRASNQITKERSPEPVYEMIDKTYVVGSNINLTRTYEYEEEEEDGETITKKLQTGGFISVLPVPRIYRDNNFEQPDLTISTGRIKTLSPIYIQSVSRITLNNILYMFDMMYDIITSKYNSLTNDNDYFDYLQVLNDDEDTFDIDDEATLKRFGSTYIDDNVGYLPLSLDSSWLLNYLVSNNVNMYADDEELVESLPTINNENNNEEIIYNIKTFRPETNIQLFSSRYFNFHEQISDLSIVLWVQTINQNLELGINNTSMYVGKYKEPDVSDPTYIVYKNYVDNFYSNVLMNNSYNIVRTVKTLISKLGEFLDFPKIIFGTTLTFEQSKTVNIQYINPVKYENEFKTKYVVNENTNMTTYEEDYKPNQKQKNNVAMFGVVFKYHQLSLGWQQMVNDLRDTFVVQRARGQKHFVVKIYDEFGRQIPNMDTSQGFKNNLRLELECIAG